MKTTIEPTDAMGSSVTQGIFSDDTLTRLPRRFSFNLSLSIKVLAAMAAAIILMDAILPLRDLWFHDALLTQFATWTAWPSQLLFPGWTLIIPLPGTHASGTPDVVLSWLKFPLLLGSFVVVFLVYLAALSRLPGHISRRFIIYSTLLSGILYMLIPVVTSPDLYSYIAYARMGALYGLNPLTTIPTTIHTDPIYNYISWVDQPSAYGPTWAILTTALQWLLVAFGIPYIPPMVIALRLLGFVSHLLSTLLIWSITGHMQRQQGYRASFPTRKRMLATLAFAWNPLLLLEAATNAHNDSLLLLLILLAVWVLARANGAPSDPDTALPEKAVTHRNLISFLLFLLWQRVSLLLKRLRGRVWQLVCLLPEDLHTPMAASALLALAACLKINIVVLFPGLLFYLWMQAPAGRRLVHALATTLTFVGIIVLLYAPFWDGGAIFNVLRVNPATYRTINTLPDFLAHLLNSLAGLFGLPMGAPIGSPAERFMRTFSMGIFVLVYLLMLWRAARLSRRMRALPGMLRWMVVAWLLYCAIGSPWFWPWYMVTFFGLFALVEAADDTEPLDQAREARFPWYTHLLRAPLTARLLTFSLLSMYAFTTWGPGNSLVPGLPAFFWTYLNGIWVWALPLLASHFLGKRLAAIDTVDELHEDADSPVKKS